MKTLGGKGRTCPALTFADYSYFLKTSISLKKKKKMAAYATHLRHVGADSVINY